MVSATNKQVTDNHVTSSPYQSYQFPNPKNK